MTKDIDDMQRMLESFELEGKPVNLVYTNWRGETAERNIRPLYMWYGATEWHPDPQWIITAKDLDKGEERDFALAGFGGLKTLGGIDPNREARVARIKILGTIRQNLLTSGLSSESVALADRAVTDAFKAVTDYRPKLSSDVEERLQSLEKHSHEPFDFTDLIDRLERVEKAVNVHQTKEKVSVITPMVDFVLKEFLEGVTGVVEATDYEQFCLWERFQSEWEDLPIRQGRSIGRIGDRPIFVTSHIAVVRGQKIAFYNATSVIVDHDMVRAWIEKVMPDSAFKDGRLNHTDAQNFINVLR